MRLHFPLDLTGNLIMIEKLVLGEIWTGDLPIFNPDALTSAPSWLEDWSRSWMVNVYKGKADALTCGSYMDMKLLEHAIKGLGRVIEGRVRKIVNIDSMQFEFMAGRNTTAAILIVRQPHVRGTRQMLFK